MVQKNTPVLDTIPSAYPGRLWGFIDDLFVQGFYPFRRNDQERCYGGLFKE